jgi:diguanylate cyclase (GGDEF)-like protein/PAS domain S-box-containing protein
MTASRAALPVRHLPGWLLVVAALLILLASAVGIEVLDARLAASLRAELTLAQVRAQINRVSAIEWEMAARHARPAEDVAEDRTATGQLTAALAALVPLEEDIPAIGRVRTLARAYAGDVDHLQNVYLAGQERAAQAWNAARVDPGYDALSHALDGADATLRRQVQGIARLVQLGVALSLTLAAAGLALLFWRYQRARRASEALAVVAAEERARARGEERFRALVQNSSDVIVVVDAAATITYVSPSIEGALGYPPEAMLGTAWLALAHPDDAVRLRQLSAHMPPVPGARFTTEVRARHQDGTWRQLEVISTNLRDEPGVAGLVVNARDITERKTFEAQLQHQAFHDALTGLPNRALFLDRLEQALARTRQAACVGVLVLDLDRFKVVNDSLGHAAGDQLLCAVAARLTECVRQEATVARLGGDEFAILLSDLADASQAVRMAERILQALDTPLRLGEHTVVTVTSIGMVTSTPTHTPQDLLRDADVALYRAKTEGRGRYPVFDAAMHAQAMERLELEADLRQALERGEFEVHYQPKVALATGRLAGLEALVRWRHPQRGLVPPAAFIPLAEESGLIRPIRQWVLEEACRQTRSWREQMPDVALSTSVNLSACQFRQPTLLTDVARALRESGVDPCCIELEMTESAAMEDAETTITMLQQLKALGVHLAIDDFGTGYSSLGYLKRFPVDVLKIDRAFVAGLRRDNADASIVHAVVSLGHALGLMVVAEGVETAEEAHQLHALGCDLGQGYYFAPPLPCEQAEAYIRRQHQGAA